MRLVAKDWFDRLKACGDDVRELIQDGNPTACVRDAAFAYVGAYREHVGIGFFNGAALDDPTGLLEGSGKRMRHVKIRWGKSIDEDALSAVIVAAYGEMHAQIDADVRDDEP